MRDIIEARLKDLKDEWAQSTGDNPDDFHLSEDDWALGLGDDDAREITLLIDFLKADDAKRFDRDLDVRAALRDAKRLASDALMHLADEHEKGFRDNVASLRRVATSLDAFARGM